MIQNLIFVIPFLKILFRAYNFSLHIQVEWTSSKFFLFQKFFIPNLKVNKNQLKRSLILQYSFSQKTSLVLRISTLLTMKIICSQNTAKQFSQCKIFQQTCFCLVSEKNICWGHFLRPKNYFLESLWKQMSVYFCISL